MTEMEYSPNGKDIMAPRECSLMVHSPNVKGKSGKSKSKSSNCHGKREKIQYKRYSANQI